MATATALKPHYGDFSPPRALHLDLVVFNYFEQGQAAPSVSQMRKISDALYDAAMGAAPPDGRIPAYVGGHSLGATFALGLAADRPVAGVFVAAPVTTGVAMVHRQIPLSRLALLKTDRDYRLFDNLRLARDVRGPTLVIGSDGDRDLPPEFTHAVYAALPANGFKREVILHGISHGAYLGDERFWREVSEFFRLPAARPLVGYLTDSALPPAQPVHERH